MLLRIVCKYCTMSCTSVPNAHLIFYCTKQKCTNVLVSMKSAVASGRMYRTNKTMTSTEPCHSPSGLQRSPSPRFSISRTQNELYQKSVPFTVTSADVCVSLHLHSPPKDHHFSSDITKHCPGARRCLANVQRCAHQYQDLNCLFVTTMFLRGFRSLHLQPTFLVFSLDLSTNTVLSRAARFSKTCATGVHYHDFFLSLS